jgi:polysaccharide deacetylase family protein (PEP-CTERM system associated)
MTKTALLSFDIEEWFQVENMKGAIARGDWNTIESSVEKNTERILYILENYNVRATFFVLGIIAEKHPDLVKKIAESGHEIASHGYNHELNSNLGGEHLKDDLKKAKALLETISGQEISGYRAPSFSVTDEVIDILKELDYKYDSSYNPFSLNSRYGRISKRIDRINGIFQIENGIFEVPLSQAKILGQNLPISGGAYFRLIPPAVFNNLVKRYLKNNDVYNFYLHPWEFEPEQPRIRSIPFGYQVRHYTGLKSTANRLQSLIQLLNKKGCIFSTMKDYIDLYLRSKM